MNTDKINLDLGFLPTSDPLKNLSSDYKIWDELGQQLPKLLLTDQLYKTFDQMPLLSTTNLTSNEELERAMLLLSFFGHAYVWGGKEPMNKIPKPLALPWYEISQKLGRPPVLSYASYALNNWQRFNNKRPIELGNITLLQNFLGGVDEEWFVLVHVDIEMKASEALQLFSQVQRSASEGDSEKLLQDLTTIEHCLEKICATLERMTEHCDPYIYYNRVRPYIHGWKDNPALPNGLIYEGVKAYNNQPMQFRGETGAQSSIVPSFDALLGIVHHPDPLRVYLMEMREYMPVAHRAFIHTIEKNGSIRNFILEIHKQNPKLRDCYNNCLGLLSRFRQTHLHFAAQYIQKQSQTSLANPTGVGTGGTPFMQYLRKHKDETLGFLVGE